MSGGLTWCDHYWEALAGRIPAKALPTGVRRCAHPHGHLHNRPRIRAGLGLLPNRPSAMTRGAA